MLIPHLFLDDREDVCRPKTEEELLCDPSLRQKALLLTKTSEIPIYKTEANALVKVIFFFLNIFAILHNLISRIVCYLRNLVKASINTFFLYF